MRKKALFKAESVQKKTRLPGRNTEVHTPTEGRRNGPWVLEKQGTFKL